MKLEIKKIACLMIAAIFVISGPCGAVENVMPEAKTKKSDQKEISLKRIPKFQKLKFINKVQEYTPYLSINDSLPEPGPGIKDFLIHPKDLNNIQVTFPGAAWSMYSVHLLYRDKINEIDSGEQIVPWKSARDKKTKILNFFGEKLEGIDVTFEIKKDLLTITVDKNENQKKESGKNESKSPTF